MIIHRSNRTELLIDELAGLLAGPRVDPFAVETLVVQGHGMERWLAMQLADRLGIWANPEILSPRGMLDAVFEQVLDTEIDPAFAPESLIWSVADLLPGLLGRPGFETIARYLAADLDGRKLIQLAWQIADTFHRYMTHRPELLIAWENPARPACSDPDERWQARLWRALVGRLGCNHLAGRADEFTRRLAREDVSASGLPDRISIFGVSSLPRLYLNLFTALSRQLELHLFMLSPSREYWADLATPRESRRELERNPGRDEASLHLAGSHSLLASLGRLGRDFQQMIEDEGSYEESADDLYRDPLSDGQSMLGVLQSDILKLRVRGSEEAAVLPHDPGDRSIRVHACHGPMREVEVLRDELLAAFEADATLEPQDIVVMAPDIETYAPYIDAVFGIHSRDRDAVARGEGTIPHRVADRGPAQGDPVVDAFRRGLDFVRGRFVATEALDLLGSQSVGPRFGLDARDLEIVKAWIVKSGIRWGVDAAHRESLGQPATAEHTWRFGLDRLLLGYAVPEERRNLFGKVRPLDGVEGQNAECLGRVLDFCEFATAQREKLASPRSPGQWRDALLEFLDGLVDPSDDSLAPRLMLRGVLDEIAKQAATANFAAEISLSSMREQIERGLAHAHTPQRFLSCGITFCKLIPMRSIPFRIVCLLGMNDDAFPRVHHAPSFDLVAKNPRVGDRTLRDDDRYLFLEALLAARERLVISFVGQSIRDGAPLPPSVVVCELLDALAEAFAVEGAGGQRERRQKLAEAVLLRHPLQPFSSRYFERDRDRRLEAHSALYCDAATRLADRREPEPPFLDARLPEGAAIAPDDLEEIDLAALVDFFRNPSRHFLRRTMQIWLREDSDELALREPFELDGLETFRLGSQLLELTLSGVSARAAYTVVRSSGGLPHGTVGRILFDELLHSVESIAAQARALGAGEQRPARAIAVELAGARLGGVLTDLGPSGQLLCRFSKLGGGGELEAWVRHLLLLAAAKQGGNRGLADLPRETLLLGRPAKPGAATSVRFAQLDAPERALADLVDLYRVGRTAPLPFFPRASREYAEQMRRHGADESARSAAQKLYEQQSGPVSGEGFNPYCALAFKGAALFDPAAKLACGQQFGDVAQRVFEPLLAARVEAR